MTAKPVILISVINRNQDKGNYKHDTRNKQRSPHVKM